MSTQESTTTSSISPEELSLHQHPDSNINDSQSISSSTSMLLNKSTHFSTLPQQHTTTNHNNNGHNIITDIKLQLSSINQQLTTSTHNNICDDNNDSNNNNNSNTNTLIQQSILMKITSQLEQQCDQFITLQHKLELQHQQQQLSLKEQQLELKEQQIEAKQQQLELKEQMKQQQIDFQQQLKEQHKLIDEQQLELKKQQFDLKQQQITFEQQINKKQIDFEQQMKQQHFDLQCERREFELIKHESQLFQQHISTNTTNNNHQQQHIPSHSQLFIPNNNNINNPTTQLNHNDISNSSISTTQLNHNDLSNYNNTHNSTTQLNHFNNNDHNDNDVNQIQLIDILHDVHQDYQAMKYLVEQNVINDIGNKISQLESIVYEVKEDVETNIRNEINDIQTNMNKSNEDMKITIDTKLNQFHPKSYRFDIRISDLPSKINKNSQMIDGKLNKFDQRLIVFEQSFQQYIIQQYRLQTIENQRKMVEWVLDENEKLEKKQYELMIFHFENLSNVRMSCCCWDSGDLFDILRNLIIEKYLKEDFEEYIPMFENSKLFISTKSILDGEWIQVQGDGKVVDIKTLSQSKLLKPGDDIYDYKDYQCSKNCSSCKGLGNATTTKRFLIKIKWA